MLRMLTDILNRDIPLTAEQIILAVNDLCSDSNTDETKGEFLIALARKGETVDEIAAFAGELRKRAVIPVISPKTRERGIMDVCGTGGDRLGTFNVSTTVAIVVSAGGGVMAKHGNRAVTSKLGSADVVEALGIPANLSPTDAGAWLDHRHFAFLFAPIYHPAFKNIAPSRKYCAERGKRTIFNFLGPLLNPANPAFQLIGVPDPALCEPMARVLQQLGARQGMVVSGRAGNDWMDEFSTMGDSHVVSFNSSGLFEQLTFPSPFSKPDIGQLAGGTREDNARIVRDILTGADRGPKRDIVLLNSGAAFRVSGKCDSIQEGIRRASEIIDSGDAARKLAELTVRL